MGPYGSLLTRNKVLRGVAIPQEMLTEIFGTDVNVRRARVEVTGPNGCFRYPIVDEGPNEWVWMRKCMPILDLTYAAVAELGLLETKGDLKIKWKLIPD